MTEPTITECNSNGQVTYEKWENGWEYCYYEDGSLQHEKYSNGNEWWYDSKNRLIHYKDISGNERKYNSNGSITYSKIPNGHEEWYEYHPAGNKSSYKNNKGYEETWYDSSGNVFCKKYPNTSLLNRILNWFRLTF